MTDRGGKKRPTQADVARVAGVSQATVSQVLNNSTTFTVPDETRRRVMAAVEQLAYLPDHAARSLRTRKTSTIACIIPDIANPFYPAFARGIQDVAEQRGFDLVMYNTDGVAEKEQKSLRSVQQGRVDGVIVVLFGLTARALFPLLETGVAVVRLESARKQGGIYPLDNLFVDYAAAARAAVTYLVEHGHRRVGLLAGGQEAPPREARALGYWQVLADAGIPADETLIRSGGFQAEGGYDGTLELLQLPEPPTGLFAANDLMAIGALAAARATGRRVPQDLAVVGFDDIPAARLVNPSLTTIAQFPDRLGRRAAEMLFERLDGVAPDGGRFEEMPYDLVRRESA
jgi:LacI family transcriptional regulator